MRDRIARKMRGTVRSDCSFSAKSVIFSSLARPFGYLVSAFSCSRGVATRSCCRNVARLGLSDRRTSVSTETEIGMSPSRARCWRLHACPVAIMAIVRWSAGTEFAAPNNMQIGPNQDQVVAVNLSSGIVVDLNKVKLRTQTLQKDWRSVGRVLCPQRLMSVTRHNSIVHRLPSSSQTLRQSWPAVSSAGNNRRLVRAVVMVRAD